MSIPFAKKFPGRTITVLIVVVLIVVKSNHRLHRGMIWQQAPAVIRAAAANQDGPIETPPLPDVGPGREIGAGRDVS